MYKFKTNIDFESNEVKNLKLQNEIAFPNLQSSDSGFVIFHSGFKSFYGWDGNEWVNFDSSSGTSGEVQSVFSRTGNVVAENGDYNADQITETINRVFLTPLEKSNLNEAFSWGNHANEGYLTSSDLLNYVPISTQININGVNQDLSENRIWNVGTVTKIDTENGISGGSITTTGIIGLTGQALDFHNLSSNGFIVRSSNDGITTRVLESGNGIIVSNGDGIFVNPTITNTDMGSSQNIFKNIANSLGDIQFSSSSNNDTIRFEGTGGTSISFNSLTKTIIFNSSETQLSYEGSTSIILNGSSFERAALTGDVTSNQNSNIITVNNNAITFDKIQDISTQHLIGRHSVGSGDPQLVGIDGGLEFQGANIRRSALTGAVTAAAGSNLTSLGTFTKIQLSSAVSDGTPLYVGDIEGNATHTGDVIGSTNLTVSSSAISGKVSNAGLVGTEEVLINNAGTLEKTTVQDIANLSNSNSGVEEAPLNNSIYVRSNGSWVELVNNIETVFVNSSTYTLLESDIINYRPHIFDVPSGDITVTIPSITKLDNDLLVVSIKALNNNNVNILPSQSVNQIQYNSRFTNEAVSIATRNQNVWFSWSNVTESVVIDSDAQSFIDSTGISDETQINAINYLVSELKTANLWNKFKAIYPIVGGTESTHKFNLKDPRDLDAAFRLTFNGTFTHNSNGMINNAGVSNYARTHLIPLNELSLNNTHISFYSKTPGSLISAEMGCSDASYLNGLYTFINYDNLYYYSVNGGEKIGAPSSGLGLITIGRISNNELKIIQDSTVSTLTSSISSALPNREIYLCGQNINGSNSVENLRICAFASIGEGLNDSELLAFDSIIEGYQTILGRNN